MKNQRELTVLLIEDDQFACEEIRNYIDQLDDMHLLGITDDSNKALDMVQYCISEASTHTNEGGTGIGLLDTWTFKKKYHISLIIEELDNNIYSKRLSFLFDGKNRYLIISSRYQQIRSYQTRSDLLVISSSENNATYLTLS